MLKGLVQFLMHNDLQEIYYFFIFYFFIFYSFIYLFIYLFIFA